MCSSAAGRKNITDEIPGENIELLTADWVDDILMLDKIQSIAIKAKADDPNADIEDEIEDLL